ncbi:S41 family peptidase [Arcticibacter eurypsychrophilus]|uniref:S41 family peptidase n=1 Tax=Arcticibacter eurypsychrophilus TaxID=1434752 RepID=UPI00084D06B5|nr:S41 family peptidase [Arcticibacter eurypsychrophilus]
MKFSFTFLCLTLFFQNAFGQFNERAERNLNAFCKLYGYVRFFHPSDEAQKIDWNNFAIYGAKKVLNAKNDQELLNTLNSLFVPIAPLLRISSSKTKIILPVADYTPLQPDSFKVACWQHLGVKLPGFNTLYKSVRLNRPPTVDERESDQFIPLFLMRNSQNYAGKTFTFKINMKGDTTINAPTLKIEQQSSDNSSLRNISSIFYIDQSKRTFNFGGKIPSIQNTVLGVVFNPTSPISLDNIQLFINDNGKQIEVNNSLAQVPDPFSNPSTSRFYFKVTSLKFATPVFTEIPKTSDILKKELVPGITCVLPLTVYSNTQHTYPEGDSIKLNRLLRDIERAIPSAYTGGSRGSLLEFRLGDIVIAWNVLRHFFPYWEDAKTTPEKMLRDSFLKAFTDKAALDFYQTLKIMGEKLNDGHVFANLTDPTNQEGDASVPLIFSKAENKIVLSSILDSSLNNIIAPGDLVESIDGSPSNSFLSLLENTISGSRQWKEHKALFTLTNGPKNTFQELIINHKGKRVSLKLKRTLPGVEYRNGSYRQIPRKNGLVQPNIYYFNLSADSIIDQVNRFEDKLIGAKAIIFDLRGYPQADIYPIISHLTNKKIVSRPFHTPKIIYPDYTQVNYQTDSVVVNPVEKRYKGKVFFLTDASAMSYSESFLGVVKDFNLGTLVGSATAGTNGNINTIYLPGRYSMSFSGSLVTNNDGSKHHLIGIVPDIKVERTIKGIMQQRDEVFEAALIEAVK